MTLDVIINLRASVIYLLISNILNMFQDLRRGPECSLLLLNVIILTFFLYFVN